MNADKPWKRPSRSSSDTPKRFRLREAELASARAKHTEKARKGNHKAQEALESVSRASGYWPSAGSRLKKPCAGNRATLSSPRDLSCPCLVVPSVEPSVCERHDARWSGSHVCSPGF
jgi:hypothetical protein